MFASKELAEKGMMSWSVVLYLDWICGVVELMFGLDVAGPLRATLAFVVLRCWRLPCCYSPITDGYLPTSKLLNCLR